MNLCSRFVIAALVVAGAGWALYAQETDAEPKTGKLLLLRGGHVMEGAIERVGTGKQIRVRNGASEIFISADKAARICADWDDAYVYLQTLVKFDDANDRVKLARWCHTNRLAAKALEQAKYALELQPGHPEATQIVATLERAAKEPDPTPTLPAPLSDGPIRPREEFQLVDVTTETQLAFTTKVQPILMNTCATCHCTGRGGKLELDRVASSAQKMATQRNLAKVLAYVDLNQPMLSPLLERAIKKHGDATHPPIHNRDARAFQTLHQWIEMTVARNPHLRAYAAAKRAIVGTTSGSQEPVVVSGQPSAVSRQQPKAFPAVIPDGRPGSSDFGLPMTQPLSPSLITKGQGEPQTNSPAKDDAIPPRVLPKSVTQTPPAVRRPEEDDPYAPSTFNDEYHKKR